MFSTSKTDTKIKFNAMKTNEELRQDVMDEIKFDPFLRDVATEIGVTANYGVITLSGLVSAYGKAVSRTGRPAGSRRSCSGC